MIFEQRQSFFTCEKHGLHVNFEHLQQTLNILQLHNLQQPLNIMTKIEIQLVEVSDASLR